MILNQEETWECFLKLCENKSIIEKIKTLEINKMDYLQFKSLEYHLLADAGHFNEEKCKKESKACYNLFKWSVNTLA